ncbi:protein kinase C delta type-like [Pseudophryne corroboree]|uniref:protein kinase C delta type-like n=1 Tax=Pseudophryne corroboree TaxID=495146 RepID=UPI003081E3FC
MGTTRRKKAKEKVRRYKGKQVQKRRRQSKRAKKQAAKRKVRRNALFARIQKGWVRFSGFLKKKKDQLLHLCSRFPRFWHRGNMDIVQDPGEGCSHWAGQLNIRPGQQIAQESRTLPTSRKCKATVPLTVEKFTFHSLLGKGGFGKVMLATDAIRNERVAVKILKKRALLKSIKKRPSIDPQDILVESQVLQLANESNFLIHGNAAFHTENYLYCVMELADGGDLAHFWDENLLDLTTLKFIAAELVCGLQFMHSRGIIHRDLKLGNVLLTKEGHVKITDFGLSLLNAYGETNATVLGGTPGYMAPEIITRQSYNAAVDWFAFGVMLYLLALRKYPFTGENRAEIFLNILTQIPTYSGLDDRVTEDFISKLLIKNQSCRYGVNGNVRKHRFFSSINWKKIETGKAASPVKPHKNSMDADEKQQIPAPNSEALKKPIAAKNQSIFNNIQFVGPKWSETYHNVPMEEDPISPEDYGLLEACLELC